VGLGLFTKEFSISRMIILLPEESDRHPDALVFDLSSMVVATDNFSTEKTLNR
jgi:hypothetical protein